MQIQAYVRYRIEHDELKRVDVARRAGFVTENPCAELASRLRPDQDLTIRTANKLLGAVGAKLCMYDPITNTYLEVSTGETKSVQSEKVRKKKILHKQDVLRRYRKKRMKDYRSKLVSATKRTAKRVREEMWEEYYTKAQEQAQAEQRAKKAEYQRRWRANKKKREQERSQDDGAGDNKA